MNGTWMGSAVRVGGDARQRFHDARGYGEASEDGAIQLAPIEAAHLLYRGDLTAVDGEGFSGFLRAIEEEMTVAKFAVYKDFRERGYYLRPASPEEPGTFTVFERGSGPRDGTVAFRVRVLDEGSSIQAESLSPGVLAIVDEEAEVGYVAIERAAPGGDAPRPDWSGIPADIIGHRVLIWDPPTDLYAQTFFGQPLGGRDAMDDVLQLSLVEAGFLAEEGVIVVDGGAERIRSVGRAVEGDRYDRRSRVYRSLREAGTVPKTGYKFGADFRVYSSFESLASMTHSDQLVRVVSPDTTLDPRAIALDVRLAHGVGKRMVFARATDTNHRSIDWLSIERLTP